MCCVSNQQVRDLITIKYYRHTFTTIHNIDIFQDHLKVSYPRTDRRKSTRVAVPVISSTSGKKKQRSLGMGQNWATESEMRSFKQRLPAFGGGPCR